MFYETAGQYNSRSAIMLYMHDDFRMGILRARLGRAPAADSDLLSDNVRKIIKKLNSYELQKRKLIKSVQVISLDRCHCL